jgi:hypothetical protein
MSDDYHDDDSRSGGLWDPDAHIPPPPAHDRPTLRVIESSPRANRPSAQGLVAGSGETLVRLDQFRPADPSDTNDGRATRARALAAGVLIIAVLAFVAVRISASGGPQAPTTQATRLSADPEQAALVRKVAPRPTGTNHRRRSHRTSHDIKSRATKHRSNEPRATTPVTQQVRSAPSPPAQQPSQSTTASKPKRKLRQYDAVSSDTTTPELTQPVASSEFGFEP